MWGNSASNFSDADQLRRKTGVPIAQAEIYFDGDNTKIDKKDYDKYSTSVQPLQFSPTNPTPKTSTPKEDPLDKLARAVAIAETYNCTKGYGVTHNNCFGIKKGNTYPCQTKGKSRMCNFSTKEESFVAFKVIWAKWYKNHIPNKANAIRWTGNDRADTWLKHVKANL